MGAAGEEEVEEVEEEGDEVALNPQRSEAHD